MHDASTQTLLQDSEPRPPEQRGTRPILEKNNFGVPFPGTEDSTRSAPSALLSPPRLIVSAMRGWIRVAPRVRGGLSRVRVVKAGAMSSQVNVTSIDALKEFRVALALYGEDALAALGAVDSEVRKTILWLQQDRPYYWQEQIKRRRQMVTEAKAELFQKKLQQKKDYHPSMAEPMEKLRHAEAALADAEKRLGYVRKWQPILQQAALEYRASTRRINDLAAGDVPRAVALLGRLIDALEAYLRVAPPSSAALAAGGGEPVSMAQPLPAEFEAMANTMLDEEPDPTTEIEPPSAPTPSAAETGRSETPD